MSEGVRSMARDRVTWRPGPIATAVFLALASTPVAALSIQAVSTGTVNSHREPVGYLDLYMTTLGYRIVPVIARVQPGFQLALNTAEVDEVFEVPLAYVMDIANMQTHSRDWNGITRHFL